MNKRKYYFGFLLAMMLMMICPVAASASTAAPVVKTYSGGQWGIQHDLKYYKVYGKKVTGWAKISSKVYYFKSDGTMKTGWLSYNGSDYYFEPRSKSGAMVTGFYTSAAGDLYYFNTTTGAAKAGTFTLKTATSSKTYYAQKSNHKLYTGVWKKVGTTYYYFNKKGVRYSKWFTASTKKYYCSPTSGKLSGWQKISNKWYCFTSQGYVMTSQWITRGTKLYYVDSTGAMVKSVDQGTTTSQDYSKIIMVGDSRFVHTYEDYGITANNTQFIAESGQGYKWLGSTAYPEIEKLAKEEEIYHQIYSGRTAIVFNLGVNDLEEINAYLTFMNTRVASLAEEYDCDLYYVSVNPVDETKLSSTTKKSRTNAQIVSFNNQLKTGLDQFTYIDTYSYLKKNYSTSVLTIKDGLHYTQATSQVIFDRIMMSLGN